MVAKTKQNLIASTRLEFGKLRSLLEAVDAQLASTPHPDDGITIKDTILHRVHWIGLFLGWYRDGVAGKTVQTPAPGYKWNQLKAYNAKVREETRSISWAQALSQLEAAHTELMDLVDSLDETELFGPKKYDWTNNWTIGRWAEASGASHYRSAAKYVRAVRRRLASA